MSERIKGDERILGDGGFVEEVSEEWVRSGWSVATATKPWAMILAGWLIGSQILFHLDRDKVTRPGRYPETVEARSVLCDWAAKGVGNQHFGALQKPRHFPADRQPIGKTRRKIGGR